jgi:hypothetical protein
VHLIQLQHQSSGRRVALVRDDVLILINRYTTVFDLAKSAIEQHTSIPSLVKQNESNDHIPYSPVYLGNAEWKILPAFDHPGDPRACMLSGTGLTHKTSALKRQHMHEAQSVSAPTDSMIMYQWGLEGGKPGPGKIGIQPEWFYKGNGSQLKAHLDPLVVPNYAHDGGEEPEIAAVYLIDGEGKPFRVGYATANEFADHAMEKKNYLYLAPSKIRNCSLGPELVIEGNFSSISGRVSIIRDGKSIWEKSIQTGEEHITHSLENLEYHHFKYDNHRLPWDAHIHFMGADAFSYGAGVTLEHGDMMSIYWDGMGKALLNPLQVDLRKEEMISVGKLY